MTANNRKTRVVILIGELGVGGTESQLFHIIRLLDHTRFECHIIVFHASRNYVYNEPLQQLGIHIWPVPPECQGVLQRLWFTYRKLRQFQPDVVHSWSDYINPYAGLAGWLARAPLRLGSLRGSLYSEGKQHLPRLYRMMIVQVVDKLVVNSKALVRELLDLNYPEHKIIYLPNCIDTAIYHDSPGAPIADLTAFGIGKHDRVVGFIGNIRLVKNPRLFVEGMIPIVKTYPDVYGVLVGQSVPGYPTLPAELTGLIQAAGVENRIILMGFRQDVPALLRRMSIVCLTSFTEGMPNTIMEAMATARPVIATRVGGVPELLEDGLNGLLINSGDVAGLTQAIRYLLDHPDTTRNLGRCGQDTIRRSLSCQQAAGQLAALCYNRPAKS